jgi:hypothetical protein
MIYSIRRKYTSLILSSLIHALVLFLLLYTRMKSPDRAPAHHPEEFAFVPQRVKPAPVSIQTPPPAQPRQVPAAPAVSLQTSGSQAPPMGSSQLPLPAEATEHSSPPVSAPGLSQQRLSESVTTSDAARQTSGQKGPSGSANISQRVTPAAFMQAFRAAIKTERGELPDNQGSEDSSMPIHVKKRLHEWGQISYRQRVAEAFFRAGSLISRTVSSPEPVDKVIYLSIPIKKNGTLGTLSTQNPSGIPEVDRFILDTLTSADFPPIPDRYNTDIFHLTLPLNISLKRGTKIYTIYVT